MSKARARRRELARFRYLRATAQPGWASSYPVPRAPWRVWAEQVAADVAAEQTEALHAAGLLPEGYEVIWVSEPCPQLDLNPSPGADNPPLNPEYVRLFQDPDVRVFKPRPDLHRHDLIHAEDGIGCRGCDLWVPKPLGMPDYTGAAMKDWPS